MIKPQKVVPQKNFTLIIHFDNGQIAQIDMSFIKNEHGPVVDPLKEWQYFKEVSIVDDIISWPTGYDIDPNFLRSLAIKA